MPYFPASQRYALPWRSIEMRRQKEMSAAAAEVPVSLETPAATASSQSDPLFHYRPPASELTRPETAQTVLEPKAETPDEAWT